MELNNLTLYTNNSSKILTFLCNNVTTNVSCPVGMFDCPFFNKPCKKKQCKSITEDMWDNAFENSIVRIMNNKLLKEQKEKNNVG